MLLACFGVISKLFFLPYASEANLVELCVPKGRSLKKSQVDCNFGLATNKSTRNEPENDYPEGAKEEEKGWRSLNKHFTLAEIIDTSETTDVTTYQAALCLKTSKHYSISLYLCSNRYLNPHRVVNLFSMQ